MVSMLLEKGADVNIVVHNTTALVATVEREKQAMVSLLLKKGSDVAPQSLPLLDICIRNGMEGSKKPTAAGPAKETIIETAKDAGGGPDSSAILHR